MPVATPKLLTVKEVAEFMGVKSPAVISWIGSGALRAIKPGREYRIRPADLEAFQRRSETVPEPKARRASGKEWEVSPQVASSFAKAVAAARKRMDADKERTTR